MSALTEAFLGRLEEQAVSFAKDFGDPFLEGAASQGSAEVQLVDSGGVLPWEPVVALAEEVVAHLAPSDQVEGLGVGPKAQDLEDVDLARDIDVLRDAFAPAAAPLFIEGSRHFLAKPLFD